MDKFPWQENPAITALLAAISKAGGEGRVVGGAVRDVLMHKPVGDLDIATSLAPDAMMHLAAAHGWKAIPTGIAHGTVTLLIDHTPYEVTTLRRDVTTDGRRATVAYTDDFEADAARRDFTVNALSVDKGGRLYDYFGGMEDAKTGRIRFIGNAADRIAEDALRILRFFRFLATHGQLPADEAALNAIRACPQRLEILSGERIAQEWFRLLAAPNPLPVLVLMEGCGLFPFLTGGEGCAPPADLALLRCFDTEEKSIRLTPAIAALLLLGIPPVRRAAAVEWMVERLKLARSEQALLRALLIPLDAEPAALKAALRRQERGLVWARLCVHQPPDVVAKLRPMLAALEIPPFPVTAAMVMARGYPPGKSLGEALKQLEMRWEASDYRLSASELLDTLP